MGTDNLFHKRKARKAADLERKRKERAQRLRYLIVCEGTKTEPNYLNEMLDHYRIPKSLVFVTPSDASSPDRIVECAKTLYEANKESNSDDYDQVFCVFDRDQHSTYDQALQNIEELKKRKKPFNAITSEPCFEYWLLLHFTYTRQPFKETSSRSSCDIVVHELKKYPDFTDYEKGRKGIFTVVQAKIKTAIKHAQLAKNDAAQTGENNPSTDIHDLVLAIQKLAGSRCQTR